MRAGGAPAGGDAATAVGRGMQGRGRAGAGAGARGGGGSPAWARRRGGAARAALAGRGGAAGVGTEQAARVPGVGGILGRRFYLKKNLPSVSPLSTRQKFFLIF